jgi:hypothetical protein
MVKKSRYILQKSGKNCLINKGKNTRNTPNNEKIISFFLLKLGLQTPLVIQKIYPEAMPVEKYIPTV